MSTYTVNIFNVTFEFHDYAEEQHNTVIDALTRASQTFHGNVLFTTTQHIDFYLTNEGSYGTRTLLGNDEIYLNFNQVGSLSYINNLGAVEGMTLERLAIHELVHRTLGLSDITEQEHIERLSQPNADFTGETVDKTNTILSEMGVATHALFDS